MSFELIVVTPIFEDSLASNRLFEELAAAFRGRIYIVAVDDGSIRDPVAVSSIEAAGLHGVLIRLKRNLGHQQAIAVGLSYVVDQLPDARYVVVMDSDGEDIPKNITDLLAPLLVSEADVVVAKRKGRVAGLRFRGFYWLYRFLFRVLTGRKIRVGNFMALRFDAVRRLAAMQELWIHFAGCVLNSKLRITSCTVDRGPRFAGQSKMNFTGLALHGFKAVMVFAEDVLVRVGIACSIVATLSILAGVTAVGLKLFGFATPGWFSIALGILLLVFLQTGALTLITLMLTGLVRGGSVVIEYRHLVDKVFHAHPADPL
jgi:hypothetical protein